MANGAFTKGTGDLKSTNLISAFLELSLLIQTQERLALANEAVITANQLTVPDSIAISADFNTDTMTVNISNLPIAVSIVSGNLQISAVDYLAEVKAFVSGIENELDVTGSSLTKTNKVQALLELAQLIQQEEAADAELDNNLTMTFDLDNNTATINATFSGLPVINTTGRIEFIPTNYLA